MANRWTGAFDAALQVAPAGADRILAAIHRKGDAIPGVPGTGPHFFHSLAFNLPLPNASPDRDLRGHLEVQVSTPSLRVAEAPDHVTVSVVVYAWFQAAVGSDPAPEFVHGTLAFTTGVKIVQCAGTTLAEIRLSTGDLAVSFVASPGSGLSAADAHLVEQVVLDFLRTGLQPVQLRVSAFGVGDFQVERIAFRTLTAGSRTALDALLGFQGGGPAPNPGAVSDIFLHANEHAGIALGREFVASTVRDLAQGPLAGIAVSGSRFGIGFSAAPDPASLVIELRTGVLRARLNGSGSLSPGGSFGFRLTQDFGLIVASGDVFLTLAGDPKLDITQGNPVLKWVLGLFKGKITGKLGQAASGLVQIANAKLNEIVDRTVEGLMGELVAPGVALPFVRASIDPDGVVLGGAMDLGPTQPVVASFTSLIQHPPGPPTTNVGKQYDAQTSWIPGGTVEQYRWTEIRTDGSVAQTVASDHRFVLRLPPSTLTFADVFDWPPKTWCLEVRGRQFVQHLDPVPVSGAFCAYSVIVMNVVDLPREGGRLTVHVPDGKGGVLADVDPWARYRPHAFADVTENRGALLVHLANGVAREPLEVLAEVLVEARRELPVFPTVVVERSEDAYASGASERAIASVAITHDPQGEWRRRFRLEKPGTTVIVGPGGAELWRDDGPLHADALEKALAGLRMDGARPPRSMPVRLGLHLGSLAPNLLFACLQEDAVITMGKMLGREVELCFWTSWSSASLEELRRRASVPARGDRGGPVVLFVNDGEDPALAAKTLREIGIEGHVVPDPDRTIARKYGISCWPTVVRVDAAGRIASARFGLEHEHPAVPEPAKCP